MLWYAGSRALERTPLASLIVPFYSAFAALSVRKGPLSSEEPLSMHMRRSARP